MLNGYSLRNVELAHNKFLEGLYCINREDFLNQLYHIQYMITSIP